MSRFPADLADTEVVSVQVTGPHRVRATPRDGTEAVHILRRRTFAVTSLSCEFRPSSPKRK
jgi:hypothetical protein